MINIGSLIASIGGDIGPLQTAIGQAEREMQQASSAMAKSMESFNAAAKKAGDQLKSVGKKMNQYLTLPMMAAGVGAFKTQKDFESSMTKITSLVGIASDQVDAWAKDVIKMAPQLGKAPGELADALFFITSAGIKGAQAMDVLEMSAKASAVGLGETKVIADLVTSAMNAYGVENLSAAQATDILVGAVREGKAEASALAGAMGAVLPISSEMGVSFDQVGAAIAAMTRTGTDANNATTQLKNILASILNPTDQAEEALVAMRTSSSELRKTIRDDGLLKALVDIRTITKQYGETAMSEVFPNIRALMGVLDLMGSNAEDNIKIFESLANSNGSLATAFEEVSQTAEHKWQKALSSGKTALTSLGKAVSTEFIPILEKLSEMLNGLTTWFEGLSESQQKWVTYIGTAIAALGPFMTILGVLVGSIIPKVVTGFATLRSVMLAMQVSLMKLTALIAANPVGALVTGIVAAGAALVIFNQRAQQSKDLLEQVHEKAIQDTVREQVEVGKLKKILDSENTTREQKQAALSPLNKISPEYFGNLKLEKDNTVDATKAVEQYTKALIKKAEVQALTDELVKLEKERIEQVQKGEDAQLNFWQSIKKEMLSNVSTYQEVMYTAESAHANMAKAAEEYTAKKEKLSTRLTELMQDEAAATDEVTTSTENLGNTVTGKLIPALTPLAKALEGVTDEWDELLKGGETQLFIGADSTDIAAPMQAWLDTMKQYEEGMRRAAANNQLFGESFNLVAEQIRVTDRAIQSMINSGVNVADPAVQMLKARLLELQTQLVSTEQNIGNAGQATLDWAQVTQAAGQTIGNSLMNMAAEGKIATSEIIKQLISQVTGYLTTSIMASIPFPANIALAAGAGLMAGAIMNKIPAFADGGVVSGPTLAMVGEYPGARTNPEVIAPLDKLENLMVSSSSGNKGQILTARISGRDLLFVLENAENEMIRTF